MTNHCKITFSIDQALLAEAERLAKECNVSLDQVLSEAIEVGLFPEDDAQLRELVEKRMDDKEVEVSIDKLVAGISDSNTHEEFD